MIILITLFWIIFFLIISSIVWSTIKNGISPMPTSPGVRKILLDSLPQNLNGVIIEAGAGWGTLAFPLARRFPNQTVLAYETSWIPYLFCKFRHAISKESNLKILRQDFFTASFHGARLIVCYLYPGAMERLKVKFEDELGANSMVVSHTFAVPGWQPSRTLIVGGLFPTPIYFYRNDQSMTNSKGSPY